MSVITTKNSLFKSGIVVGVLLISGKILSFVRDILISSKFGATIYSDAYFAANNVPSILFTALISSAILFFIPFYNEKLVNNGEKAANKFASNIINVYAIVSIIMSFAGIFFAGPLISLIAPGFTGARYYHAVQLTRILCSSFPFSCATLLFAAISNARQRYIPPQLIPIISSLFVIVGIVFFSTYIGIYAVAISSVLAFIIQAFLQKYFIKDFYHYQWEFKIFDNDIKAMSILILPVFIGTSVDQLNLFVDSVLSSKLPLGSLSALNYGQRLQATINGTFSTALVTIIYPIISIAAANRNYSQIESIISKSIRLLSIILIPITIIMMLDTYYIVKLVYFRGKFGEQALINTSSVFMFYSISLIFMAYEEIYRRVFYIYSDSKTPLKIGIGIVVIHLLLSFIFIKQFKVAGLAMATSLSCIISSFALRFLLKKKWNFKFKSEDTKRFLSGISTATIIMIFCHMILKYAFKWIHSDITAFFIYATMSTICYFIVLLLIDLKEMNQIKHKAVTQIKKLTMLHR